MQEFPQPKLLDMKDIHEMYRYKPVLFSNSSPQGRASATVGNMKPVPQSDQHLPLPCCTKATEISRVSFPLPTLKMHPQPALPQKLYEVGGAVHCSFISKDLIVCFLSDQKNIVNTSEHYRKSPHSIRIR